MGKKFIASFTLLILFFNPLVVSAKSIISINDLVNKSLKLDEKNITIQAEVIGEVLERGDDAWINVNDGSGAIGIWLRLDQTTNIKVFGDYFHIGDQVRIKGVFNRSCIEHGGEMDIHATEMILIEEGSLIEHSISSWKFTAAMILVSLSIGLAYLKRSWFLKSKTKTNND